MLETTTFILAVLIAVAKIVHSIKNISCARPKKIKSQEEV